MLLLALAACATSPPVQEMSDARQAIAAAKEAGAETYAAEQLGDAEGKLASAEEHLQSGVYWLAKRDADDAKNTAFEALLTSRDASQNQAAGDDP